MSSGRDEQTRSSLNAQLDSWKNQLEAEVRQFNASRGVGQGGTAAPGASSSAAGYTGVSGSSGAGTSSTTQASTTTSYSSSKP